jgi:broad specificity phosphatase PhoE
MRHGATDLSEAGVFQGRSDVPLNDLGVAQARSAAERLKADPPGCIYASPQRCALQTAEIIASTLRQPFGIDERLTECDFGSFEGRSIAEVMREHGIAERSALPRILPKDAEPWQNVSRRSLRGMRICLDNYRKRKVLFVTHDAVMQAIAELLCGHWFGNPPGAPWSFERGIAKWTIRALD